MTPFSRAPLLPFALLIAAVALAAGCSTDLGMDESATPTSALFAVPTVTEPAPDADKASPTTLPVFPDTRGVELAPVAGVQGSTYEPVEIYGGHATVTGSLAFGGEAVAGATVRLERWVGGNSNYIELETGEGGGWLARDVHGGRYVVRAWKGGNLVLPQAGSVFVEEDGEAQIHLAMTSVAVAEPDDDEESDEESEDDSDDESEDEDDATGSDDESSDTGDDESSDADSDSDADADADADTDADDADSDTTTTTEGEDG